MDAEEERPEKTGRHCYVGVPEIYSLATALMIVQKSFNEMPYLVGSATETVKFRDVDVRMIFDDRKFETLFGKHSGCLDPFWNLLTVAISEYLQKRTGLPVDFQIQKRSGVTEAEWKKFRNPIGMFYGLDDAPDWRKDRD